MEATCPKNNCTGVVPLVSQLHPTEHPSDMNPQIFNATRRVLSVLHLLRYCSGAPRTTTAIVSFVPLSALLLSTAPRTRRMHGMCLSLLAYYLSWNLS